MTKVMMVMQYAMKLIELSRFVPKFAASQRMIIRRFDECLVFYIRNQLAG